MRLVVHCDDENNASKGDDLAQDLLAIVNIFVARHNGRRAAIHRKKRRHCDTEHQATIDKASNSGTESVVRDVQMDV